MNMNPPMNPSLANMSIAMAMNMLPSPNNMNNEDRDDDGKLHYCTFFISH
jgi:hypothetical protein